MSSAAYFDTIYIYLKEVKYMDTTRSLFKHEMEIVDYLLEEGYEFVTVDEIVLD